MEENFFPEINPYLYDTLEDIESDIKFLEVKLAYYDRIGKKTGEQVTTSRKHYNWARFAYTYVKYKNERKQANRILIDYISRTDHDNDIGGFCAYHIEQNGRLGLWFIPCQGKEKIIPFEKSLKALRRYKYPIEIIEQVAKLFQLDISGISKTRKPTGAKSITTVGLRFDILKRDNYRCQICGRTAQDDNVKLEIDHKIPRAKGGTNRKSNLWTLCFDCNRGKRDKDL